MLSHDGTSSGPMYPKDPGKRSTPISTGIWYLFEYAMPRPSGPKTRGPSIKMAPDNRTYGSDPIGRQQREYFEVQLARVNAYIMVTFGLSGQRAQPK